ncbi:hypothetical protein [Occallatibacter riparius]|uniref:Uncharacterized protein n=1 Tax=Occallatibacter riparius TaxID=1002689 RepID=A0A9J7BN64_9BACT|nr:hypothetical protein [Occallatibacter riparius]UWZ84168.1 hypothetical protein MOP44_26900 [Occallatibacter riparius]
MLCHVVSSSRLLFAVITGAAVFGAVQLAAAQTPASYTPSTAGASSIPAPILNARTVFIANGGADGGLFPEPFSGDPNRGYFAFFAQLKSVGKYDLVSDPSQADLVMDIQLTAPNGPRQGGKQLGAADPLPFFKLVIYDAKTRFALWTITEPIEWAILQKTHDRNFDDAVVRLSADVQALSQKSTASLYPQPSTRLVPAWQR